jgi:hypothetical protein
MSVRVHWTTADQVALSTFNFTDSFDEVPEAYQNGLRELERKRATILRLVIEDPGNMEGFVIDGQPGELIDIAQTIIKRVEDAVRRPKR